MEAFKSLHHPTRRNHPKKDWQRTATGSLGFFTQQYLKKIAVMKLRNKNCGGNLLHYGLNRLKLQLIFKVFFQDLRLQRGVGKPSRETPLKAFKSSSLMRLTNLLNDSMAPRLLNDPQSPHCQPFDPAPRTCSDRLASLPDAATPESGNVDQNLTRDQNEKKHFGRKPP